MGLYSTIPCITHENVDSSIMSVKRRWTLICVDTFCREDRRTERLHPSCTTEHSCSTITHSRSNDYHGPASCTHPCTCTRSSEEETQVTEGTESQRSRKIPQGSARHDNPRGSRGLPVPSVKTKKTMGVDAIAAPRYHGPCCSFVMLVLPRCSCCGLESSAVLAREGLVCV